MSLFILIFLMILLASLFVVAFWQLNRQDHQQHPASSRYFSDLQTNDRWE